MNLQRKKTDPDLSRDHGPTSGHSRIGLTALFTNHVWFQNGLVPAWLLPAASRRLWLIFGPVHWLFRRLTGFDLQALLLQRHSIIDHLLRHFLSSYDNVLVVELACGWSGRGTRLTDEFDSRQLTYVETDLPATADRKEELLRRCHRLPHHRVQACDALAVDGRYCLDNVLRELPDDIPLVVIAEGLLVYLEKEQVRGLLTRVHQAFEGREAGLFLGDVVITPEPLPTALRVLRAILRLVSGGRVERHFHDNDEAQLAMEAAGFGYVRVHDPADHRGLFPPRAEAPVDALRVVEACY